MNEQTGKRKGEEWILNSFLFFLRKLYIHKSIRIDQNGNLHRRFWKGMEGTLHFKLLQKHEKPGNILFYQFMEEVAHSENWIVIERDRAVLTENGIDFLKMPRSRQWNLILGYVWP
ncbi:hypothetical protein ACE4RR_07380 [Alteribacillus sp. HJP-4]